MRFITTKKNIVKCNQGQLYQNEGPVTTINGCSNEYDAKLRRYEALRAKKLSSIILWNYDKDQPELEALEKWLREHADK